MPSHNKLYLIVAKQKPQRTLKVPFAVAELSVWGASWRGVSGVPTKDPVKNGASSNDCYTPKVGKKEAFDV